MTSGLKKKITDGVKEILTANHELKVRAVGEDVLKRLRATDQIYIIGHDTPISVSNEVFAMCRAALVEYAAMLDVPVEQVEMEDLFAAIFMPGHDSWKKDASEMGERMKQARQWREQEK